MERKNRQVAFLVIGFYLLCSLMFNLPGCIAQLSWSDNFDDGNYDGWTVEEGSFTAVGNSLNTTGTSINNFISHNSTAAYGFWSFDLYVDESEGSQFEASWGIAFIREGDYPGDVNAYVLEIWSHAARLTQVVRIVRIDAGSYGPVVGSNSPAISTINGWQAINITRSLAGEFEVFINGTTRLQATDTMYTNCDDFVVGMTRGSAFDNLVVSGTDLDLDLDSSITPPQIPGFLIIAIAGGIGIALVVTVVYRRRQSSS